MSVFITYLLSNIIILIEVICGFLATKKAGHVKFIVKTVAWREASSKQPVANNLISSMRTNIFR